MNNKTTTVMSQMCWYSILELPYLGQKVYTSHIEKIYKQLGY
jgi:hypothetical protein